MSKDKETGTIVVDREMKTISSIIKQLSALDEDARTRVLRYLQDRYKFPLLDGSK